MSRMTATICLSLLLSGCDFFPGPLTKEQEEQRELFEAKHQQEMESERQARVQRELEALKQELAEQKRQQLARRTPPPERPAVKPSPSPAPETAMTGVVRADPVTTLQDMTGLLAKRSIYYDFDTYNVREDFKAVIDAHAKFLLEHKDMILRIEGNTDERGSREYNLALGQRRADAVKRALLLLGVGANQIQAVSFGPEKPKASGHDEQAYAENRRSDLMYVGQETAQ